KVIQAFGCSSPCWTATRGTTVILFWLGHRKEKRSSLHSQQGRRISARRAASGDGQGRVLESGKGQDDDRSPRVNRGRNGSGHRSQAFIWSPGQHEGM